MSTKEQIVFHSKSGIIESAVTLLDNSVEVFKLQGNCTGHDLFQMVVRKLGLLEFQYFDLAFLDIEENHCWLDHGKGLAKLARNLNRASLEFIFAVKYYVPHPHLLANDHARYLFAAQIKRDFFRGLLHSNRNTSLLLAAFIVQSELGDYNESECRSYAYLRKHHLLRTAPDSYLMRVMELHQSLIGLSKAEADYRLLDAARKVELYGVRLHPVKDNTDEEFNLAVTYIGIVVFRKFSRVNGFGWAKIRKLSFKRCKFLIKLHTDEQDLGRELVEFNFYTQTGCKIFWKKCIEQHAFFRSHTPFHSTAETRRNSGLLNSLRATSFPSLKRLCRSLSYESGAVNGSTDLSLPARPCGGSASSSTQTSQMSTPLRRLPRFRYRSSSLKHSKAAVHQSLNGAEDLQNCLSQSLKRNSLANKSPYASSYNTLPSRPPGVTRLLSQYNGASDDHFQLLRLSFTSLIPQSTSDTGQNTPTLGRLRTRQLTRVDRASSTPSIGQTDHAKRKTNAHCLVPRHFDRFVASNLPRSKASSMSDDPFPERPFLSKMENSPDIAGLTTQGETLNGRQTLIGANLTKEEPTSSTCSLCSSESPSPVSFRNNTARNLSSPWNHYSSGHVSTEHSSGEDASSAIPSFPNAWKPPPLHAFLSISSPHLIVNMDSTEQSEIGSSRHVSPRTELCTPDLIDGQLMRVSTASYKSASMEHSPSSLYNAAFEKSASFTGTTSEEQKLCSVGQEDNVRKMNSTNHLEGFVDTSPSTGVFKSQFPADPTELEYVTHLVSDVIADGLQQIIAECDHAQPALLISSSRFQSFDNTQTLDEYISSSMFQLSSTATGLDAEVPESLADALSLGAISMMTGMFTSNSEQEDHSAAEAPVVSENYAASSIKSCISLKQLGRGYWGPTETSSEDECNQSFKMISVCKSRLSRARSESAVVRTSKETSPVPNAQRNKKSRPNRKRLKKLRGQPTRAQPHTNDRDVCTPQHPMRDEFTLQVMKRVLQSEVRYHRDLRFLAETTLNMAESINCTTYIDWMRQNLLPLLNPLMDRHSELERVMLASVTQMEQLGTPIPGIPTNSLFNSHEGSSIENLDPADKMATLSEEKLIGTKISSSETVSTSDISRPDSPRFGTTGQYNSEKSNPSISVVNGIKKEVPVYLGTILIQHLDLIQLYNTWLNQCSRLLAELWLLGYADFLPTTKIPSLTRTCGLESIEHTYSCSPSVELNKEPFSASNSSPALPNNQPLVRELWNEIESCRACTLPFLTYLLQPGRHMRKYCVQLGALLSHYPADHPDASACKVAFTEFVQAARTSYPVYQQTEQLALVLQMSRWILPMDSFLGISKYLALSDEAPHATTNMTKEPSGGVGELSDLLTQVAPLHQFGWLRKYSKRGFQPRMVFVIGDRLLYASRIHGISQIALKLHAIIPLHNVVVEKEAEEQAETKLPNRVSSEAGDQTSSSNYPNTRFSVTVTYREHSNLDNVIDNQRPYDEESIHSKRRRIRKHRRKILFSAPTESVRDSWVEKLQCVIASYSPTAANVAFSLVTAEASQGIIRLPDPSSSDILRLQLTLQSGENNRTGSSWSIDWKHTRLTAQSVFRNNLLSICWRRHLTMSHTQLLNNNDCEMHGMLFRKFQRGSGYQKLWTVLSEFCMTFYKNPEDPLPQTTLTLPGYSICCVDCSDGENADEPPIKRVMSRSYILLKRGSKEHSFRAESNQSLMSWFQALQTTLTCIQFTVPCGENETPDEPPNCSAIPRKESSELVFSCTSPCRIRLAGSSVLKT